VESFRKDRFVEEYAVDLKFILGRKEGMTQIFTEQGNLVPVTVVVAGPCYVVQVKTPETDGYSAVQVGFGEQKLHRLSKSLRGHFKKANLAGSAEEEGKKKSGLKVMRHLKEFRVTDVAQFNQGDEITVDVFEEGDLVDVVGTSKGRGFAGVMKRWNFRGGPKGHGGMCDRRPGAIGMHSDPSRVFKGKKMAGHWGHERITVKNLEVAGKDPDRNVLFIRGSVPGARNGLLYIRTAKTGIPKVRKEEAATG
jgi:large subunit ribosomal protein L3